MNKLMKTLLDKNEVFDKPITPLETVKSCMYILNHQYKYVRDHVCNLEIHLRTLEYRIEELEKELNGEKEGG